MIKHLLALAAIVASVFVGTASANENDVKKNIEPTLQGMFGKGLKVDAVRKLPGLGLYELQIGTDLAYTDEKASFLFLGDLVDLKSKKNLTDERKAKLSQIKFSELPLDLAVKTVRGNGKRVIATFEDPNCGYCKKLGKELAGMTDMTVYTFLYPILSPDSTEKAKGIWCSADKSKAWNDWIVNGAAPAAAGAKCDTAAIDKVVALGQKLGVRGTPTIFFTDGNRVPGYMPAAQLEKTLNGMAAN